MVETCKDISYKKLLELYNEKYPGTQHKKLKIELCHEMGLLSIPIVPKNCSLRGRKNRYMREELELMALKKGHSMSILRDLSYKELCTLLDLPSYTTEKPSTKHGNCLERSSTKLKSYQERVIRYFDNNRQLLIFHKMGSGKTLTAITIAECYLDKYPTHHVIVILPAILKANFENELDNVYRNSKHRNKYNIYSIQTFVNRMKKNLETVQQLNNSLLIVDEVHNLRTLPQLNRNKKIGINTFYVAQAIANANKILLLSGTPIFNSIQDIRSIYYFFNPELSINVIQKLSIPDIIKGLSCKISYYEPTESSTDFPTRNNHYIGIPMSSSFEQKYDDLVINIQSKGFDPNNIELGEKDLSIFYNGLRRGVNLLEQDSKSNHKLQWVFEKLRSSFHGQKTIIFSHFKNAGVLLLSKRLNSNTYGIITGDIPMSKRKQIIQDYNSGKKPFLFITKAAGEGINLYGTRNVIILEPSWNDSTIEQVIARAIRYKSHEHLPSNQRHVDVYHLYHLKNNDMSIFNILSDLKRYKGDLSSFNSWIYNQINLIPNLNDNSIDLLMYLLQLYKHLLILPLLQDLYHSSLEYLSC